jgi:probable addiction module antidote protein
MNPMQTKSYDALLTEELRDPELAAAYLSAAIEEGSIEQLLIALRAVAEANGGIAAVADKTQLNRQAMYKILSAEGNPTLTTLLAILNAIGLNLTFIPQQKPAMS